MKGLLNRAWQWIKKHCCLLKIVMHVPSPLQNEVTKSLRETIQQSEESIEAAELFIEQLHQWIEEHDKTRRGKSSFRKEGKLDEIRQWSLHLQSWRVSVDNCKVRTAV